MRVRSWVSVLALAAAGAGCGGLVGLDAPAIEVRLEDDGLHVANHTDATIYFTAVNPRSLVLWVACTEPDSCDRIESGSAVTLGFDQILGWGLDSDPSDVDFHYWRLVPTPRGDYRADRIRTIRVSR
ncbi:MAG: hypothetical protein ACRELD_06730 [Longimicrobiales bacterium]